MVASGSSRPFARGLIRQLRLKRKSRVLDVGCGNGALVGLLRRSKIEAFGLFDGPSTGSNADSLEVPELQPATLHQSVPFLAQSFDAVVVRATSDYAGSLATPQACTATANLLASLKPGGQLLYCGQTDFNRMKQHLAQFPGQGKQITLRAGGLFSLLLSMMGLSRPGLPALEFTIPGNPVSRLEWHRIAREAVTRLSRSNVADDVTESGATAGSPAA